MRQLLGGAGDGKIDDGEQGHGGATLGYLAIFDAVYILYKSHDVVIASWDRQSRRALDETVGAWASAVFCGAVGKEVDYSLVRESPVASWTRVAWISHTGAEGLHGPGARFLAFFSDRRLCRRR